LHRIVEAMTQDAGGVSKGKVGAVPGIRS
jgi:hypothetical protein